MTKEKGRKWDGKSRVSNPNYRKRFEEIFGKKEKNENNREKETRTNKR